MESAPAPYVRAPAADEIGCATVLGLVGPYKRFGGAVTTVATS